MTQFNLLPDIKLKYLQAERLKRLVISFSILIVAVSVVLVGVLFSINLAQKSNINHLKSEISTQGALLGKQSSLSDMLTVQNQIQTLTTLHQQEPEATNLATYLNEIIPASATISTLNLNFDANTVIMSGGASSLAVINQLVDSLKFATYSVKGVSGSNNAFSGVILTSFGLTQTGADYTINFNYAPSLFNITDNVSLNVPTEYTTRSELNQPSVLFQPSPKVLSSSVNTNGG